MAKPKFIVLSGRKQAGKTTAANKLRRVLAVDRSVRITSFASPIKDFMTDVLGLTTAQVYGTDEQKNSPTHVRWDNMPAEIKTRYRLPHLPYSDNGIMRPIREFMTAREVMQIFGTDIMRTYFDNDIWSKAPFTKYGTIMCKHQFIIVDDCRFPNEADAALENDATLIRLERNVASGDLHSSELAMDDYPRDKYDYIIQDQPSVRKLERIIVDIMSREGWNK